MSRSAAGKIMWVGRATVFLVGLAVLVALVFGAASTVEAHTGNKGFFHLGHKNVSQAISTLVKKGAGPALKLNVGSGPPLAVNSSTKVNNLNADKLDGVDESQFQRTVAKPGQVLSGQIAFDYVANRSVATADASYPVPLPADTPTPILGYVPGAPTATCPGIGQATAGRLCVYAYNKSNISSVHFASGSVSGNLKLYGFALVVLPATISSNGHLLANWTYKVS